MHAFIHLTAIYLADTVAVPVARVETRSHKYYLLAKGKVNRHHDCRLALHRLPLLISSWHQGHKINLSQWFMTPEAFLSTGFDNIES